jgi:hypothetical protein
MTVLSGMHEDKKGIGTGTGTGLDAYKQALV